MTQPSEPNPSYLNHLEAETRRRMEHVESDRAPAEQTTHDGAAGDLANQVERRVDGLAAELHHIVQDLHKHPETAFAEHRSVRTLTAVLEHAGVETQVGVFGVETAFRAEAVGTTGGPTIAIIAEYDALPEVGHACGHNVIAAAAVGAFLSLAHTLKENPHAFPGCVVLLGTPAEEGHSGKEVLARNGAFDGIDAAIMVHPYGYDLAEQVWLGRRLLTLTFTGVAAHASAQPFMGRNALDAANLVYQGMGLLRQQLPPSDRIHAVISAGGTRPSIITERAELKLYARSKYPDTLKDLSERLTDIARGAALMTGTGVDIAWDEHPPSLPVRTNGPLTSRWVAAQQRRGRSPLPADVVSETIAASTDFGNVSYRIPGIHPLIRIADSNTALHTRAFAEAASSAAADRGALDAAAGLALTALDYLSDEKLQRAVAQDFASSGGAEDVPHYFD